MIAVLIVWLWLLLASQVERYQEQPGAVEHITDRDLAILERKCKVLASSSLVPKRFRGKPNDLMVVAITANSLGVEFGPRALKQFWISPDGSIELSAQLQIGLAARHGFRMRPAPGGLS